MVLQAYRTLGELGADVVVHSVDLGADGQRPDTALVKLLRRRGFRIRGYRSTALTPGLLSDADLVLVMTGPDGQAVVRMAPAKRQSVFTFKELLRRTDGIGDPRPDEAFDAWLARADAGRATSGPQLFRRGTTSPTP